MIRVLTALLGVTATLASHPAVARDSEAEKVEALIEESWFTGTANYPDEFSPALTPFLHCELRRAGSRVIMGGEVQEGPATGSECNELREAALTQMNEVLDEQGITSTEARTKVIRRAFGAVDALAASQRIWREAIR